MRTPVIANPKIITRNPVYDHIANGGIFASNVTAAKFWLNGAGVNSRDVMLANSEQGFILVFQYNENRTFKIDTDTGHPVTKKMEGHVEIEWPEQTCGGCANKERQRRVGRQWWAL